MPGPNQNVHEIVQRFLDNSQFNGLFNESIGCSCKSGDLAPCGEMTGDCECGYLATPKQAAELGVDTALLDSPFWITRVRP